MRRWFRSVVCSDLHGLRFACPPSVNVVVPLRRRHLLYHDSHLDFRPPTRPEHKCAHRCLLDRHGKSMKDVFAWEWNRSKPFCIVSVKEFYFNVVATVLYFTGFIVQLSVWGSNDNVFKFNWDYFKSSNIAAGVRTHNSLSLATESKNIISEPHKNDVII